MGCPGCLGCDAHPEAAFEDRMSGTGIDTSAEEGSGTDPDLEEWLAARLEELEERRFALFDLETERR